MKAIEIKQDDITEEMISDLVKFLDSNPWTEVNPEMAILYGRFKARWMKLDKWEEWINKSIAKRKEDYKWKILNQMKQWKEEIENENRSYSWHYEYQLANLKSWTEWRTIQLWFPDTDDNGNEKWRKSVEIEEWKNPEFFQEMLEKYLPKNENKNENSKPF
jgi:hypothetical protein